MINALDPQRLRDLAEDWNWCADRQQFAEVLNLHVAQDTGLLAAAKLDFLLECPFPIKHVVWQYVHEARAAGVKLHPSLQALAIAIMVRIR